MDRLKGLGSFVIITAALFLGLRGAHLLVGTLYPASLPGPFQLASLDSVEQYTGFWPHIPFYRPSSLGTGPAEIVAERRPLQATTVRWQGESFLELSEWSGNYRPEVPDDAAPLPDLPNVLHWTDGDLRVAVLQLADRWIRLRTDLGLVDIRRIIDTLMPYDRLI